ncbi:MAG: ribosome silencing factor [Firmicutes bacterium]|uniref:Ribosomal silencing factor RsfS n=1 Tax=Candidatus Gallilactobacillus intestinavium TaxID=2840838 RepID=A0A9D9E756_9LACO|nr:ribosome silencing factor [Candidatus Gallilactobacillus intestinavium]
MNSKEKLAIAVKAGNEKLADNIVALDVNEISYLADYFLFLNGGSKRQVQAIVENILDKEAENGVFTKQVEGRSEGTWTLLDFGDLIVHVFQEETRNYYNLEKLWSSAKSVDLSDWLD